MAGVLLSLHTPAGDGAYLRTELRRGIILSALLWAKGEPISRENLNNTKLKTYFFITFMKNDKAHLL
jgi:hypothetical protein